MANSDDRYEMLRDRELSKLSWVVGAHRMIPRADITLCLPRSDPERERFFASQIRDHPVRRNVVSRLPNTAKCRFQVTRIVKFLFPDHPVVG